jgi:hypothetical protein
MLIQFQFHDRPATIAIRQDGLIAESVTAQSGLPHERPSGATVTITILSLFVKNFRGLSAPLASHVIVLDDTRIIWYQEIASVSTPRGGQSLNLKERWGDWR